MLNLIFESSVITKKDLNIFDNFVCNITLSFLVLLIFVAIDKKNFRFEDFKNCQIFLLNIPYDIHKIMISLRCKLKSNLTILIRMCCSSYAIFPNGVADKWKK